MNNIAPGERVLVTGFTGSLGSALIPALLAAGARVRGLSRDEKKQLDLRRQYPEVECRLGDVRDSRAVRLACMGIETVIHCLHHGSRIRLADGTTRRILDIVRDRESVMVRTFGPHGFVDRPVTAWYDNRRGARRFVRLSWVGAPRCGPDAQRVWLTEDHRVLTSQGWIAAGQVAEGDLLCVGEPCPNVQQRAFIIGTLLGDASLGHRKHARACLTLSHSVKQEEWALLKAQMLGEFFPNVWRGDVRAKQDGRHYPVVQISTRCWASLGALAARWYRGRKSPDLDEVRALLLKEPARLLAAWYLDDGFLVPRTKTAVLSTDSYTAEEVAGLVEAIRACGIEAVRFTERRGARRAAERIRFSGVASDALFAMIGAGIPPSMRYKAPLSAPTYDKKFWRLGVAVPHEAPAIVGGGGMRTPCEQRVFCLGVQGTENFIAGTLIVHNCASLKYVDVSEKQPTEYVLTNVLGTMNVLKLAQKSDTVRRVVGISTDKCCSPVNVYGLTKALLEKLFVEAHMQSAPDMSPISSIHSRGVSFVVSRYGNVASTRGSVIPFWAEQRRQGKPLSVTDPRMTRFFFTLTEAVDLIDVALGSESGVVVSKAMRSCALGDLVDVMQTNGVVIVGRRPGEKIHEELLTAEEMARTTRTGEHFTYRPLSVPIYNGAVAYTSDAAPRLSRDDLLMLLKDDLA